MSLESNLWRRGIEVMNSYIRNLKKRVGPCFEARCNKVFDDFLLSINRDAAAS